jgi:acyl-CoA synthetase (AMP-forming)/AMP-acid ligase II
VNLPYSPTLPNVIRACVENHGEREFIVERDKRRTYAQIEAASAELALGLAAGGVGKATRVGLLMANGADWVTAWWAIARLGAFAIPISTVFQARELAWLLARADVHTLLAHRRVLGTDFEQLLEKALPGLVNQSAGRLALPSHPYLRRIAMWGESGKSWASQGPDPLSELPRAPGLDRDFLRKIEEQVTPGDLLMAICTSGSTAEPKIVVHTHGSVIRATQAFRPFLRIAPDERNYSGLPLFWLGGLNVNLLPVMYEGACMVFAPSPRVQDVLETLHQERVTRVSVHHTQRAALAEAARASALDLGCVKRGLFEPTDTAGHVIPVHLRSAGNLGMTETFGGHGYWPDGVPLPAQRSGAAGKTLEGIERMAVDPQTRLPVPPGAVGEIHVRGFSLMDGYYKRERSEVFTPDGFFPTADLCVLDEEGFLYFKARLGEAIKSSGANVAPREVELALLAVSDLNEAVVFGLPDERKGEKVACVVVPAEGSKVTVSDLRSKMKDEISHFKIPTEFFVLPSDALPRTASGKPAKARLKEMAVSGELPRL